jgi:hypothetical protein
MPDRSSTGVTRAEYESVRVTGEKLSLVKAGEVTVRVRRSEEKTVVSFVEATNDLRLPISVFEFSEDGDSMACEVGKTHDRQAVNAVEEHSMTGAWRGKEWTLYEGFSGARDARMATVDPAQAKAFGVELSLGIDSKSRRMVAVRLFGQRFGRGVGTSFIARWPKE